MGADEKSRPYRITGENDKPIDIPAGEFYFNSKARCRRMMLDSLSSEARQVYACLEMATMGFSQERAVVMDRGQRRPLTTADIAKQTELQPRRIREAFVELEQEGLAERRSTDDSGVLQKGRVEIYSWAEPRPTRNQERGGAPPRYPDWFAQFPPSWDPIKALIRRLKLTLAIDEEAARGLLAVGEAVARDLQNAHLAAERFVKAICAPAATIKEERTERQERTENSDDDVSSGIVESPAEVVEDHHHHDSDLNPQTPRPPDPHLEDTPVPVRKIRFTPEKNPENPKEPSLESLRVLLAKEGLPLDRRQAAKVVSDLADTPVGYYLQKVLEQREQYLLSGRPFKPGLAVAMAESCRDKWLLELDTGPVETVDPRAQRMQETANRWRRRHGQPEVEYGR